MRVYCSNCGEDGHAAWMCRKPATKPTAARKDVPRTSRGQPFARGKRDIEGAQASGDIGSNPTHLAGTQALPVDTSSVQVPKASTGNADGGKPLTQTSSAKFDKVAYQRAYMVKWRAAKKAREGLKP